MRVSTVIKIAAVVGLVVTVALIAVAKSIDVDSYKSTLTEQVGQLTGRTLTISGPLELKLGLNPSLSASGITFSNAQGGSRPEMVTLKRIEARVALLPLLKREVRIKRLVLVEPDILLERDAKGRANWDFAPAVAQAANAQPAAPQAAAESEDGSPFTRIEAREIRIEKASIAWNDAQGGRSDRIVLDKLTLASEGSAPGAPLALALKGTLNGHALDLSGVIGSLAALSSDKPYPLRLKGSLAGLHATAEGGVADPFAFTGLDVRISLQGEDLAEALKLAAVTLNGQPPPPLGPFRLSGRLHNAGGPLALTDIDAAAGRKDMIRLAAKGGIANLAGPTGIDLSVLAESDDLAGLSPLAGGLPSMGPLKLSARLTEVKGGWKLADLKGNVAASDLGGEVTLTLAGPRPHVAATLASTHLALADLLGPATKPGEVLNPAGTEPSPAPAKAAAGDGKLFPADPLPLESLRGFDADLALSVGRFQADGLVLSDLKAQARVKDGRLTVRPATAMLAGGHLDADLAVDAGGALTLRLAGDRIDAGRLVKEAGDGNVISGGPTALLIDLKGKGASARALMASLSGVAQLSVGEGQIHNRAIDWAGGDLLFQVLGSLNPLAKSEDHTRMSCAVARFVLKDGIATAERGIAMETDKVTMVGSGTINLRDESVDIGITPRARQGIGLSLGGLVAGLTRVRGPLASPGIGIDEVGTALTAASIGAAVATGGLSVLGQTLFDRVAADSTPCQTALGSKPAGKAPAQKTKKQ